MRFIQLIAILLSLVMLAGCATTSEPVLYSDPSQQMPTAGSDAALSAHQMY